MKSACSASASPVTVYCYDDSSNFSVFTVVLDGMHASLGISPFHQGCSFAAVSLNRPSQPALILPHYSPLSIQRDVVVLTFTRRLSSCEMIVCFASNLLGYTLSLACHRVRLLRVALAFKCVKASSRFIRANR